MPETHFSAARAVGWRAGAPRRLTVGLTATKAVADLRAAITAPAAGPVTAPMAPMAPQAEHARRALDKLKGGRRGRL